MKHSENKFTEDPQLLQEPQMQQLSSHYVCIYQNTFLDKITKFSPICILAS
jgi:hypothetical protein